MPWTPATPDQSTPEWLTRQLAETGTIARARVVGYTSTMIGQGRGCTGIVVRLDLTYDPPEDGAPTSIVVKFPNAAGDELSAYQTARQRECYLRCAREIRFYQQVASGVRSLSPKMYGAVADMDSGRFVLLLEA